MFNDTMPNAYKINARGHDKCKGTQLPAFQIISTI